MIAASSSHRGPDRRFEGHKGSVSSISIFPGGARIVTGSFDKTIRIWKLEDGKEVVKWVVDKAVGAVAVLQNHDAVHVVSAEGDVTFASSADWHLWVRDAETRAVVAGPLGGHTNVVADLKLSQDGRILASSSSDCRVILWDTSTWKMHGDPLWCGAPANVVQFSPSSGCIGVATNQGIQIWDSDLSRKEHHQIAPTRLRVKGHADARCDSLAWTRDGTRLFSAGAQNDPVIRSWDTSTWKQAGDPWTGHSDREDITQIVLNSTSTLLASTSTDLTVRLWMLSTGTEVARYEYKDMVLRIVFSEDGRSLFGCGMDGGILQWNIPADVLAAARRNILAGQLKTQGPSRGKQRNNDGLLDSQIPGQRRERLDGSRPHGAPSAPPRTDAERPSPSRLHGVRSLFNRMQHQWKRMAPVVVNVPHAPATYRDYVASEEDGRRPYALFFCLLWCQAKEEKPDPIPQVYDVDLMNAEQEGDPLDVPIPTSRVKFAEKEDIELVSMAGQPQAVAGPSRIAEAEGHQVARSSAAPSSS